MKIARDFNLWMEPTKTICERANQLKVADVMHVFEKIEYNVVGRILRENSKSILFLFRQGFCC